MPDENAAVSNNSSLQNDLYKWKQRARELKAQLETLTRERDELKATVAKQEEDLDVFAQGFEELENQVKATPDERAARIKELEKELWTRDTRAKFEKLANENKVRPEARDDLWELLKFDPEKDAELDDAGFTERVAAAVKARESYLVQSDPATGNGAAAPQQGQPAKPAPREPGPGLSRGAPEPPTYADPATAARARLTQSNALTPNGNLRLA